MRKVGIAGVLGLFVALIASGAATAVGSSNLEVLNPSGGTNSSDGIQINYASGNIQILRNGLAQIYPAQSDVDEGGYCASGILPDPAQANCVWSGFAVSLSSASSGGDNFSIGSLDPWSDFPSANMDSSWDSVTSESNVQADGSGTIHSVLTKNFDYCLSGCTSDLALDVVLTYTYPNQYFKVTTNLSFSNLSGAYAARDWVARVYYVQDATLSGVDEGNQFSKTDSNGKRLVGVIRPDGTALEGMREISGNPVRWYAGDYACPVDPETDYCPSPDAGGWITDSLDLPNTIDTDTNVDNGFAVQSDNGITLDDIVDGESGDNSFDLLFMACTNGTADPTACIESGGVGSASALADTGMNPQPMLWTTAGAGLLVLLGSAITLVVMRRKSATR